MKTKLYLLIMAAAAVIITLSSCEKEPYEPTIIDSDVLGEGISSKVTEKTITNTDGTTSTSLSYESWLNLKVETRAFYDRRASIVIDNNFRTLHQSEANVLGFVFNDYQIVKDYTGTLPQLAEGQSSVYVSDSLLRLVINRGPFTLDFPLPYKVPVYNDGITKQKMPYYTYTDVKDLGYDVAAVDSRVVGDKAYACKMYTHKVEVCFNDIYKVVEGKVLLMREMCPANQNYLVKSKRVGSNVSYNVQEGFVSRLIVNQAWSSGENKDAMVDTRLNVDVYPVFSTSQALVIEASPSEVKFEGFEIEFDRYGGVEDVTEQVKRETVHENLMVKLGVLQVALPLVSSELYYDDMVLQTTMKNFKFSANDFTFKDAKLTFVSKDVDGNDIYKLKVQVEAFPGGWFKKVVTYECSVVFK